MLAASLWSTFEVLPRGYEVDPRMIILLISLRFVFLTPIGH